MAKKQIKLSEEQLRDMIAENVNKVLSELDWKTYANARKKAADKGQYDRSRKFGNAANSAFNDKFGYQGDEESEYNAPNVRGDIFLNRVEAQNNDYPSHTIQRLYNYDNDKQEYSNPKNYDNTKAFGLMDKYDENGRYKRIWNPSLKRFFNNPEQEKAYRTASKEMDDYVMGNYGYDKGKGWQLKENKITKIVAESVKKVLKESMETPYGRVSTNPLKPTFDDTETQNRLKNDTISMLSQIPTDRFMKYWNMRMQYDDPDMVDAIYAEYHKRHSRGEI